MVVRAAESAGTEEALGNENAVEGRLVIEDADEGGGGLRFNDGKEIRGASGEEDKGRPVPIWPGNPGIEEARAGRIDPGRIGMAPCGRGDGSIVIGEFGIGGSNDPGRVGGIGAIGLDDGVIGGLEIGDGSDLGSPGGAPGEEDGGSISAVEIMDGDGEGDGGIGSSGLFIDGDRAGLMDGGSIGDGDVLRSRRDSSIQGL